MTHPSSFPEHTVPEQTVPLHAIGPSTPRWAGSATEPTVQLPAAGPRPAWVPLPAPPPAPAPARYGAPVAWAPEPSRWDRPAPNPYDPAPPAAWVLQPDPRQLAYQQGLYAARKSRVGAGVLGLLLGVLGVHNFYLGRSGVAVLQLLLTVLSLGVLAPLVWLWSTTEAVLILLGTPSFAADRRGIPLR